MVEARGKATYVNKPPPRGKNNAEVNGEKSPPTTILPYCQMVSMGVQVNLIYIWYLLTSSLPISFILFMDSSYPAIMQSNVEL